jgi:hypothetical protein|nr:hypothetical protein [uncultured Psychroserpens sp.]
MVSIRQTPYYVDVLKEFNYDFGSFFVFDGFVVSEINEGVTVTWEDHMKVMTIDVCDFLDTNGEHLIYISHRINSYAGKPTDWLQFFKYSYNLKGYGVVGYSQVSTLNTAIENLFFNKKIIRFNSLDTAIQWANDKVLSQL